MLISLHIENIAVIKSIDIDFRNGLTALTGETGAGKSIIIDSINLLLGAKADKELVRNGESRAMVSGLFSDLSDAALSELSEVGIEPDEEGMLLVQRSLGSDGRSQLKLNGRAVSLSVVKSIASQLVGIHGQNDTNSLSDAAKHLDIVDTYAGNSELLEEYNLAFSEYDSVRKEITEITDRLRESERMKEILEYQINDIESLSLRDGEEEELVEKKVKIRNSEKIIKNSEFAFKALKGSEKGSAIYLLDRSVAALNQLAAVIPEYEQLAEELRDISYKVDDVAEKISDNLSDIDENPTDTLNEIEERLDKISKLKRKYGLTVADIIAFGEKARRELETIENSDGILKELSKREAVTYEKALSLAEALHESRSVAAKELEERVKETLEFLDMPKVVFFASIKEQFFGEKKQLSPRGSDSLEFFISANRGAEPQPISKIASGGELARIMLAIKSVIADKDGISTVIFDEIDAGVSGKTARKIGIKMLSLSKSTQIFCVTHSAQIASLSDAHLLISKSDVNGKTETSVRELDMDGRIHEISRILGGIDITDSQKNAARDMIEEKAEYISR